MNINEAGALIKEELEAFGEKCVVNCHSEGDICCYVMLESLVKNNKTRFEMEPTLIGNTRNDYYSVIFPYDVDIRNFGMDNIVQIGDRKYYCVRADKISVGDDVAYFRAILKNIQEESDVL